jgi:prophage antirepressor-like protein
MGDLIKFDFRGHNVRQVGTFDAPEWVAKDVCDVLGIAEARSTLRDFPENEKGVHAVHTLGGPQQMLTVKEPGFYRLVNKSRKPDAQAFQSFVFGEVLPSLRSYRSP